MASGMGGNPGSPGRMSPATAFEQLRILVWNLTSYSNSRIVQIAKAFVDLSKESPAMASGCHKAYREFLERSLAMRESRRCLALLYVCNEILTLDPLDEGWQGVLADAMLKSVPLICELATRQQVHDIRRAAVLGCARNMLVPGCAPVALISAYSSHGAPT